MALMRPDPTCYPSPGIGLSVLLRHAHAQQPRRSSIHKCIPAALACTGTGFRGCSLAVPNPDPGRALVTGRCQDIGKTKGPILRGLAGRAPFFHNGSRASLIDAVNFYDNRFNIGLTTQEKAALVAFLSSL